MSAESGTGSPGASPEGSALGITEHRFGVAIPPLNDPVSLRDLAVAADRTGLGLVGIPDHPYSPAHLDVLLVSAGILARSTLLSVFTDAAHLPMRPAAGLATAAAALDCSSRAGSTSASGQRATPAQPRGLGNVTLQLLTVHSFDDVVFRPTRPTVEQ